MIGAVIVLSLLFVVALAGVVFLLPAWLEERHRRKCSEAAAERLRQRVRELRSEPALPKERADAGPFETPAE